MIRILRRTIAIGWILAGALFLGVIVYYGAFLFLMNPTPWNFPGDLPVFDLLIYAAGFTAIINGLGWVIVTRLNDLQPAWVLSLPRLCTIVSLLIFMVSAAGILERQDERWAAIRNGIRHYGDAISAVSGDKGEILSHENFEKLKREFMPTPVELRLPGYGTVRLRMAHGVYPYVGVDFGEGANALFDPKTMICTYAD